MDISLISSIVSAALAVIAIWLSLHHKKEADSIHEDTRKLLVDIKSDAKSIANFAAPELQRYGDAMRSYMLASPENNEEGRNAGTGMVGETFSSDDLLMMMKRLSERTGIITPVQLIIELEDRITATDLMAILISLRRSGKIEWKSDQKAPEGDEEIRLTKGS